MSQTLGRGRHRAELHQLATDDYASLPVRDPRRQHHPLPTRQKVIGPSCYRLAKEHFTSLSPGPLANPRRISVPATACAALSG
jgi:hypothetical protein